MHRPEQNGSSQVVDAVVHYSNLKLAKHFKTHPQLALTQTPEPNVCVIRTCSDKPEQLRLHQVLGDSSRLSASDLG